MLALYLAVPLILALVVLAVLFGPDDPDDGGDWNEPDDGRPPETWRIP